MPDVSTTVRKSHIKTDPIRNFKFLVNIDHTIADAKWGTQRLISLGFMNMSGLSTTTEVIPYREGGNNTTQRKMPGQTNFSDITLSRGVTLGGPHPWSWMKQIFSVNAGDGTGTAHTNFRCNIVVYVLAHPVTMRTPPNNAKFDVPSYFKFKIYNAWITGMAFSELDAGGNAVFVQQMTIAHEGFEINVASGLGQSVT